MSEELDQFNRETARKHCEHCADRFILVRSRKTGELYLKEVEPCESFICSAYDGYGWTPQGPTYEKKPDAIFENPEWPCPCFKDADEFLAQMKIHIPNYMNEGEAVYDDEIMEWEKHRGE